MTTQPILAFDCAIAGASVALCVGGRVHVRHIAQSDQASQLVSAVDGLMREHGVAYADLGCMVTTIGPGSFTGVRIGLAALHGFALVAAMPIKTLSSLAAMAWAVALKEDAPARFHVAVRAGKGELYTQCFALTDGQPLVQGEILLVPEASDGWDAPCFGNHMVDADARYLAAPDAAVMCAVAERLSAMALAEALPLYIRPPDAVVGAGYAWLTAN